jgi:2-polyprenyl-6-methoxyphenol hydroxylase-like FAD-dependent oxidoreductase
VDLEFRRTIGTLDELGPCDLIVAADGVNSLARRTLAHELGASVGSLDAKFAWYGTAQPFDTLTQTFVECDLGTFNAHHYRYAPGMSTFIVECDPATWVRAGLDKADEEASRRICEGVFAATLQGGPLVSNRSVWRNFPWVWSERWWHGNVVLIGDALHTAHYSIGSGTRLAMEDALALAKALEAEPGDVPAALGRYEAERKPIVAKLVAASRRSAAWYERFPEHMRLSPRDLAMSYIQRSGRVGAERLRAMAPRFMAEYERGGGLP